MCYRKGRARVTSARRGASERSVICEERGEGRGGAYYTVHITLHYALRRPNASNVFCSAELPAWDPWQGVPCVASWAI